jgi:hypothetical protein
MTQTFLVTLLTGVVGGESDLPTSMCSACIYEHILINQIVVADLDPKNEIQVAAVVKVLLESSEMVKSSPDFKILSMSRVTTTNHLSYVFTVLSSGVERQATAHAILAPIQILGIDRSSPPPTNHRHVWRLQ